jgi:hypothetical protein
MIYDSREFLDTLINEISIYQTRYDRIEGGDDLSDVIHTVLKDNIIDKNSSALFECAEELYEGGFFEYVSFDNGLVNAIKSAQYDYYMDIVFENLEELRRIFLEKEEIQ